MTEVHLWFLMNNKTLTFAFQTDSPGNDKKDKLKKKIFRQWGLNYQWQQCWKGEERFRSAFEKQVTEFGAKGEGK